MTNEEFGWLVTRLETQAANAPRAFRVKVFLISIAQPCRATAATRS